MQDMAGDGDCPFTFNFDAATFKPGDVVSYRVSDMDGFPFVGELAEVHDDHVIILPEPGNERLRYRGTRESRPVVAATEVGAA